MNQIGKISSVSLSNSVLQKGREGIMRTKIKILTNCFIIMVIAYIGAACSSSPAKNTSETQEDVVLSRIDGLGQRPDWLKESEPFTIREGKVYSLGQTTVPADNNVSAAFRIAENNGKAGVAGAIEQRLEFVFQNAEEGTSLDSTQARFIGAEASKLTTSSLRLHKRYWEKVATTTDQGERVTRYKVFALVQMPEEDFKKALLDAVRRQQGKGGLSADFAKKVDQHWDRFISGNSEQKTPKPEGDE